MATEFNTPAFKKLKKKWEKKLKDSGFNDIEKKDGDLVGRIRGDWNRTKSFQQTQDYFLRATQVPLQSLLDKENQLLTKIWLMHAEGIPALAISRDLECSLAKVMKFIKRVQIAFNLKRK